MKESRWGIITSVTVHACAIPLLVAGSLVVPQRLVKVVEVDFSLLQDRPREHTAPEAQRKAFVKRPQAPKGGGASNGTAKPAGSGKENQEAIPPKEVEPPREPAIVTASDAMSETVVHGVAATYADATGSAGALQSHGGFPGGRGDSGQGGGSGRGQGGGQGGDGLTEGGRDYNYIRDAIMRNIQYPDEAMRLGIEGKVLLSFIVLENGTTGRIEVVNSSGYRLLDQSAREAVAITRIDRKVPYRVVVRLPITYRLQGGRG
jgi:protein TonB